MTQRAHERAGASLARAVDHVWVLTLPGSSQRVSHMRELLEQDLRLPSSMITFFEGASCASWGSWPPWLQALQSTAARPNWWLSPNICDDDDAGRGGDLPPQCLQTRYRRCVERSTIDGSRLPAVCNELCYTLSVVGALRDFLRRESHIERALLLEDDVCATSSLLSASSLRGLDWLHANRAEWDLVKLGDCYRGFKAFFGARRRMPEAEVLATGRCATKGSQVDMLLQSRAVMPNNSLLPRLPWAYCTHALAVSRRMATHLIAQAFPASDVFDNLLVAHVAPQARRQQLKLWAFNQSLFAQVAKVTPARILPSALLSYERTVGEVGGAGESARTGMRARHRRRGSSYRPPRPLG